MAVDYDGSLLIDGQRVLEDYYDEDYEPDEEEIRNYCRVIGLDYDKEPDLVYIAVEGLKAPLPKGWKPIQKPGTDQEIYYFNFLSGESQWEHPCDQFYKDMLERERGKLKPARGRAKEGESGRKVAGLDLLPGATGLLRGGPLAHDLPPLRGHPSSSTTGVKLGPLGSQKAPFGQGPPLKKGGSPGSRYLKSPVSAVSDASQTTGSPALGVGVSPDFEHPSVSPGALYLKPTTKQTGNSGGPGTRSPAPFELGKNIAAQFEEEDDEDEDDDDDDDDNMDDFNKRFNLQSIDAEEQSPSTHDVSEEIAKVTGLEPEEDRYKPPSDSDGEDELLKMKEYAERLDRLSPGRQLGPVTGASYLKTPPKGSTGKHSEQSSDRSSGVTSPKRPSSSYGRQGHMGVSGGVLGQPNQHHVISMLNHEMKATPSEEDGDEGSSSESVLEDRGPTFSPPLSALHKPTVESIKFDSTHRQTSVMKVDQSQPCTSGTAVATAVPTDRAGFLSQKTNLEQQNEEELMRLHGEHRDKLESLVKKLTEELKTKENDLLREHDAKLDKLRRDLSEEQIKAERNLRTEKENALEEFGSKIQEEQDEEEARLNETKANTLLKLKQQLERERAKEEGALREEMSKAMHDLRKELQEKQAAEEDLVKGTAQKELEELKDKLNRETEQEKENVRKGFQEDLVKARKELEQQLSNERSALEEKLKEDLEALQKDLDREKETRIADMKRTFQDALTAEDEKLRKHSEEKNKAEEELQAELAVELEQKRKDLLEQHKAELDCLRESLETELDQCEEELRLTHGNKVAELKQEMEQLEQKLSSSRDSLVAEMEEQEKTVELKRTALTTLESELENKKRLLEEEHTVLKAGEDKLQKERERVKTLQKATEEEAKELMRAEKKEVSDSIAKDREVLAALQSSCSNVKMEVEQLQAQTEQLTANLQETKKQEQASQESLKKTKDEEVCVQLSLNKMREEKELIVMSLKNMKDEEEASLLSLKKMKDEEKAVRSLLKRVKEAVKKKEEELKKLKKQVTNGGLPELRQKASSVTTGVQTDSLPVPTTPVVLHQDSLPVPTTPIVLHQDSLPVPTTPVVLHQDSLPVPTTPAVANLESITEGGFSPNPPRMTSSATDTSISSGTPQEEDHSKLAPILDYADLTGGTLSPQHESTGLPPTASGDAVHWAVPSTLEEVRSPTNTGERETSFIEVQEIVDKHRSILAERKAALKKAELELAEDWKQISKELKKTKDITMMDEAHSSLREEAVSIREVERNLSTFDELLTLKKERMKDLEMSFLSDGELSSDTSKFVVSPPTTKYSSPKSYMRRLRERMATEMKTGGSNKLKGFKVQRSEYTSDTESSGVSSTATVSSFSESETELSNLPSKYSTRERPPTRRAPRNNPQSDMLMASIQQINGKLWQVLDRLNEQSEFSQLQSRTRLGAHPPHTPSYPDFNAPGDPGQRWADRVSHHFGSSTQNSSQDVFSPAKWKSFTGHPSTLLLASQPGDILGSAHLKRYDTPPQKSTLTTEERLKKEKDWLKEFRKDMALSSSRRFQHKTSLSGAKVSPSQTLQTKRPDRAARLVIDKHNNIQLLRPS